MKTKMTRIIAAGLAVLALAVGGAAAASADDGGTTAAKVQPTGPQSLDTSWG